jgi:hypothetical protein
MEEEKSAGQLEMDVIRFGISTTTPKIVEALEKYNRIHNEEVSIHRFPKEETRFFAKKPGPPSNHIGVYFFGRVTPEEVIFGYVGKSSLEYLKKFYAELVNGKLE